MKNLTSAVELLRDSNAIDPVICVNNDGSYSVMSRLSITHEAILCEQSELENWTGETLENITDEDCELFAKHYLES